MASTLKSEKTIDEKATTLINLANDHGGEDNITLIIIEYYQNSIHGDAQ